MGGPSEFKPNRVKPPKWLQRESSSALRVIAARSSEDFLKRAAVDILYKRGESIAATDKDYSREDLFVKLLSEKDRLIGDLRFRKCTIHGDGSSIDGYIRNIICVIELEKNYLSIKGYDGFFYIRPLGCEEVELHEEYDITAVELDAYFRHQLRRYEDIKNVRSNIDIVSELVDKYLEKVGMTYETVDRYGKPAVGRITSLRMNKTFMFYNVTLFNSIDAVQINRVSAKKICKREDLKADSQTAYYHDKAVSDWANRLAKAGVSKDEPEQ